jgi:hypothetical protein
MRRITIGFALTVLLIASVAMTAILAQEDRWKSQTFLSDYSLLKPVQSKGRQDFMYTAPGSQNKVGMFDSVMVDQPEISMSAASPYGSAKPDDLKAISEFMRSAIVARLKAHGYEVVDKAGERVLYLRVAMTDVQLKKKKRGVLAYTPVGAVVHELKGAVQNFMKNVDIIDMSGQAEVTASQTGEVLGAMATLRSAEGTATGKPERMTFDEFKSHVEDYSDLLACRLENGKRPPEQRVDCTDPAVRRVPGGRPAGK